MAMLATRKTGNPIIDWMRSPQQIMGMVTPYPSWAYPAAGMKLGTKLLIAGAGVGAVGVASYLGGSKIAQDAALKQTAKTGDYFITAQPGSTVNLTNPTTGAIQQKETSTQSATQIDTGGITTILLVVAAVAALSILK